MTVDPRFLQIEHWSALTSASLIPYGFVASTASDDDWQDWGNGLKAVPALQAAHIPSPSLYTDWRNWAVRVNESLRTLGL